MALKLTTKGAVRFAWTDDAMEALFVLKPSDSEQELVEKLRRMLAFVEERTTPAPLPVRTPGVALQAAQGKYEAPAPPANGWAAMAPQLPEDRQGEWEFMPPEGAE
jgi:hypothetical protein